MTGSGTAATDHVTGSDRVTGSNNADLVKRNGTVGNHLTGSGTATDDHVTGRSTAVENHVTGIGITADHVTGSGVDGDAQADEGRQRADGRRGAQHGLLGTLAHHVARDVT